MKKRLLSALLALALVFVLLPTTALAGETTYSDSEITISGKYWNFGNKGTSGEYAPVYFRSNGTAFEESEPTGSNYLEIRKTSANEITIKVHGTVDLTEDENSKNSCISVNSMHMNKRNLIITGAAKGSTLNLTCKNYSHPLYSYEGAITINGGVTVNATSQYSNNNNNVSVYGIQVSNGHNLTISGANTKVNVANKTYDSTVKVDGNITVSGGAQLKAENKSGKVTGYTSKKAYAIECVGQLSISGENTKVTAKTSNGEKAISGTVYNLTENDDYKLTFKAGMYEGAPSFDYPKPMDKALGYEYVEITQAPTDPYVFIAGEPAIMGQETPIPGGSGTYLYKKTTYNGSFLTLKGVDITGTKDGPARFIQFGKNGYYTIELKGENKISGFSSGIVAPSVSGVNDVTVVLSGSGSLDISANQYAIDMQVGNLKFENTGKIMLTTGHNYVKPLNALHVAGNVTIDKAKYDITGEKPVVKPTTEDIGSSPVLETILKGTSTDEALYFKSITITPAAAKPSTIRYNGTTLKQGETIKDGKGGTATVDSKNNTITLKNFNGTAALSFDATLADSTLVLEGTNTLSSIVTTQKGLTISSSGSGSLTVGSIKVTNNDNIRADLTITDGAAVIAKSNEKRAIDVNGSLTVTGASLTATSKSDNVPTVQVGGNASFTGSTVTITNNSTTQGKSGKNSYEVSTGLYVGGTLDIKNAAKVTSTVIGGNAIYAKGDITISGDSTEVNAQNSAYKFSAISTNGTVNISDNSTVKAENLKKHQGDPTGETDPSTGKTYNACPAITGKIANKNTQNKLHIAGFTTSSAGSQNPTEGTPLYLDIAPGSVEPYIHHYKVTITRGDAYTTPQVAANYTIAGQTMYVGKYYKTNANGNITDGTAQDYNIYCDSENDFTLNNATISSTGTSGGSTGVIKTNLNYSSAQFHIKLIGTNSINNAGHHAILGEGAYSTIIIENAENASNASLTISGNFLPVYSFGNVTINAEVVIINTNGNLISTNKGGHANGAFDLGSGYKCYASTSTTGTPLEEFNSANYSTYKYLRVTTLTLETGGGSTHQHVEGPWEADTQGGHHIKKCTECGEVMISEEHRYNYTYESPTTHKVNCGVCGVNFVRAHSYTNSYVPTEDGTQHHGKCICGAEETTLRDHVFVNGVCVCGVTQSGGDPTPDVPAAPTGLVGVAPTSENGNGKITGTTAQMEYASSLEGDWTTCANDSTDVPAGKYYVRMKKTDNTPAGEAVEVTVPAYSGTGEIVPPTPDNPGTIVIIRPAEEEKPAQQPNPSTGANDLVGLAVAAAVAAALGSAALLRKHD